ncbi:MerR family DNA-binding transcriptional regulator [Bacillus massilioanorexius]|uniref:MerR family DNA-binding transcriptional regulator n=1 Tax=Bacillus TaxID=1386 RepID=UPI001CA35443
MFSIGVFSKINKITTKTLRHYDEIGLLKPDHVDDLITLVIAITLPSSSLSCIKFLH